MKPSTRQQRYAAVMLRFTYDHHFLNRSIAFFIESRVVTGLTEKKEQIPATFFITVAIRVAASCSVRAVLTFHLYYGPKNMTVAT